MHNTVTNLRFTNFGFNNVQIRIKGRLNNVWFWTNGLIRILNANNYNFQVYIWIQIVHHLYLNTQKIVANGVKNHD